MNERYDIAIIGSGPAGISAALNAKIRNKRFIIFGSKEISTKLVKAHKINNYLGFYGKSGVEIRDEFANHLKAMDIEITEEKVNSIYAMGDYFTLIVNDKMYEATSIILATGVNFGKPFKGEEEFLGKGVGYCATCDAPLYKDKVVTIIAYKQEIEVDSSIEIIKDIPVEIVGDSSVKKLILKNSEIETDGVFILRDSISPGQLVPGLKIENNHVEVDRTMKTNIKGCYAAGDIVGTPYQYIKAAGEGNIAALSAVSYIEQIKRKNKEV